MYNWSKTSTCQCVALRIVPYPYQFGGKIKKGFAPWQLDESLLIGRVNFLSKIHLLPVKIFPSYSQDMMYGNFARSLYYIQDKKTPIKDENPPIGVGRSLLLVSSQYHAHTRTNRYSLVVEGISLKRESLSLRWRNTMQFRQCIHDKNSIEMETLLLVWWTNR